MTDLLAIVFLVNKVKLFVLIKKILVFGLSYFVRSKVFKKQSFLYQKIEFIRSF